MRHFLHSCVRGLLAMALLWGTAATSWAQAPAWQTAIGTRVLSGGGTGATVTAATTDAAGNVYLAGWFDNGLMAFGRVFLSGDTHASSPTVFVAKWNTLANHFDWALVTQNSSDTRATGIAVSSSGVYVTGYFSNGSGAAFGSTRLTTTKFRGLFVAKITDAGPNAAWTWAQKVDTNEFYPTPAIAAVGPGVYLASTFGGSVTVGATVLTTAGGNDVLVARLADAGTTGAWAWAMRAGGAGSETATALAANGTAVYLAGAFDGTTAFGSGTATSAGGTDAYLARLSDGGGAGSFDWVRAAGGPGTDNAQAVAVNGPNVYLAGSFAGTAAFGPATITSAGLDDAYVAKLTDAGASSGFAWAQQGGGAGPDQARALALDGAAVYVVGSFSGTAAFGGTSLSSAGGTDAFAARLLDAGTTGSFAWARQAGSTANDAATAATAANGRVSVAGSGGGGTPTALLSFGSVGVSNAEGGGQAFLASLTDATTTATNSPVLATGLTLAPNPAHGTATVQLPAVPGAATATLTLLDALGRAVRTQPAALNARTELALAGLPAGLYAVRVQAGGHTATTRLVVE